MSLRVETGKRSQRVELVELGVPAGADHRDQVRLIKEQKLPKSDLRPNKNEFIAEINARAKSKTFPGQLLLVGRYNL